MVNYPASLDVLTNPVAADPTTSGTVPHATQHANLNDIAEALEAKLGIGAGGPPASASVLRRTGTGVSAWGQVQTVDIANLAVDASKMVGSAVANRALVTVDGTNALFTQVVQAMIAANAVGTSQILDANVTTAKLAASAVTQAAAVSPGSTSTTSPTTVNIAGSGLGLTATGGPILAIFLGSFYTSAAGALASFQHNYDAVPQGEILNLTSTGTNNFFPLCFAQILTGVPVGARLFTFMWKTSAGTLTMNNGTLMLIEFKR